ncbi:MAG: cation-translocating P-type ATPase, partial [Planctomycetes bacterium]|nr:cation-translocating P-type ATPase [Planctomycetota bacterium]
MSEGHEERTTWREVALTAFVGVGLLLTWLVVTPVFGPKVAAVILTAMTLIGGQRIFLDAVTGLARLEISADLAVAIAAGAALAIGQYFAAAEVIFIMLVGGTLEAFAVGRTRGAIRKLMALTPRTATVRRDGHVSEVPISQVVPGDVVLVKPGERIPVDGVVSGGKSLVNQSAITGESVPVEKTAGHQV